MDLNQKLVINFKAERKASREPDWENKAKNRFQLQEPGSVEMNKQEVIDILKRCLARLEGDNPQRSWEPRAETYPYTSMGLALLRAIRLLDVIYEKLKGGKG